MWHVRTTGFDVIAARTLAAQHPIRTFIFTPPPRYSYHPNKYKYSSNNVVRRSQHSTQLLFLLCSCGFRLGVSFSLPEGDRVAQVVTWYSLAPHLYAIALYNKERAPGTAEWDWVVRSLHPRPRRLES